MNAETLRNLQAPLKEKYRESPSAAMITLRASGQLGEGISCKVATGKAIVEAGLHPATGGTGMLACSGDLLLEALVACAGVTLSAVATAIGVSIKTGSVQAEGDLDFRGTLGVSKEAPVGLQPYAFPLPCTQMPMKNSWPPWQNLPKDIAWFTKHLQKAFPLLHPLPHNSNQRPEYINWRPYKNICPAL